MCKFPPHSHNTHTCMHACTHTQTHKQHKTHTHTHTHTLTHRVAHYLRRNYQRGWRMQQKWLPAKTESTARQSDMPRAPTLTRVVHKTEIIQNNDIWTRLYSTVVSQFHTSHTTSQVTILLSTRRCNQAHFSCVMMPLTICRNPILSITAVTSHVIVHP